MDKSTYIFGVYVPKDNGKCESAASEGRYSDVEEQDVSQMPANAGGQQNSFCSHLFQASC